MPITLAKLNQLPSQDGAITPYLWPTLKGKAPNLHARRLIFVNGMSTTPEAHRAVALCLSELAESYVVGVYNQKGFSGYQYSVKMLPTLLNDPSVSPALKYTVSKLNEMVGV